MNFRAFVPLIVLLGSTLAGCNSQPAEPVINFVGISTGSVVTDLEGLHFSETFPTSIRDVLGVVSFKEVADGTQVQATWFSPDDRRMPLGRHTIAVESGANVAKFSIARQEDWTPAPYMLDIRAFTGEGENRKTASGQVHFYVGMEPEEIEAYNEEYNAWLEAERAKREQAAAVRRKEDASLEVAKQLLQSEAAGIAFRFDIDGDNQNEILVVDPLEEEALMGAMPSASGALFSLAGDQFAVVNLSGSTLLVASKQGSTTTITNGLTTIGQNISAVDQLTVHVYEEEVHLTWQASGQNCTSILVLDETALKEQERSCKAE